MKKIEPTKRTRVVREPHRGVYDRDPSYAILDEALVCHIGFMVDGQPYVIPTLFARVGDIVYFHGSAASRMLRHLGAGAPMSLTVTLVDGIVLARSVFNHSINYRSVVVLGTATVVDDVASKREALEAFTDKLLKGRWGDARPPTENELAATSVLRLPLDEFSAKVRIGPPIDKDEDLELPVWAGVLPLRMAAGAPIPDARCDPKLMPPRFERFERV
ncbi:MAG: pyridoxamine 5'-phosphate oxidase family protein [Candidatus Eremiobacterales bacterium]|jgi:hypothetical protein